MVLIMTASDYTSEDARKIISNLTKVGVNVKLQEQPYGEPFLVISMDEEVFRRVTNRYAGAQRKVLKYNEDEIERIAVSKVISMIKKIGVNETASILGMSRRTLYRRLKECRENNLEYIVSNIDDGESAE